jgi:hypothetical protein
MQTIDPGAPTANRPGRRQALAAGLAVTGGAALASLGARPAGAAPPPNTAEVFNVMDYGAVPDWVSTASQGTDNASAIGAAVADLNANGGGVLFFPRGDQSTGHTGKYGAAMTSGGTLATIDSRTTVLFEPGVELHTRTNAFASYTVFSLTGETDVIFRFVHITDHGSAGTNHQGISAFDCDRLRIDRCSFADLRGVGVLLFSTVARVTNSRVVASSFTGCTTAAIHPGGQNRDILIEGCSIRNCADGINLSAWGVSNVQERIRIVGNRIANSTTTGVFLDAALGTNRDVQIVGNTLSANLRGVDGGGQRISITSNLVEGSTNEGIRLSSGTSVVAANTCANNGANGIAVTTGSSLVFGNITDGLTAPPPTTLHHNNLVTP